VSGPGFEHDEEWYLGVHHREEAARQLVAEEDLLRVGRFRQHLDIGDSLDVTAWAGDLDTAPPPAERIVATARERNRAIAAGTGMLGLAADAFIIQATHGPDVVAGYPWFGVWSRDTMTAYEGLFLTTGRYDEGRALLRAYGGTLSGGMLANTADTGSTEYNTADATLWYLHAVDRHVARTGDTDLAAELVPALDSVIGAHLAGGCRYGIRIDDDGLLTQGSGGHSLTWMDAVVNGVPITPRAGKAVELNALWINGLAAVAGLRSVIGRDSTDLDALRHRATQSFMARFRTRHGWLADTVDGPQGTDESLRPNQLLAWSLPHAPLRPVGVASEDLAPVRAILDRLLTPLGPRSLAPGSPDYAGHHRGGVWERDHAYHQGTVWPWLIGPAVDAARAVGLPTATMLDGLMAHVAEWGIGSVSETADGDAPHIATGCPFQAWSVAELLRVSTVDQ
jgi:predicted glycogen debranching enzyme